MLLTDTPESRIISVLLYDYTPSIANPSAERIRPLLISHRNRLGPDRLPLEFAPGNGLLDCETILLPEAVNPIRLIQLQDTT